MITQTKLYSDHNQIDLENRVNDFIKDKYIIDIKYSVVQSKSVSATEMHILIIYQVPEGELA